MKWFMKTPVSSAGQDKSGTSSDATTYLTHLPPAMKLLGQQVTKTQKVGSHLPTKK
jgi:hypothetical protein